MNVEVVGGKSSFAIRPGKDRPDAGREAKNRRDVRSPTVITLSPFAAVSRPRLLECAYLVRILPHESIRRPFSAGSPSVRG